MEQNREYFAFISYQRGDEKWADWLRNKLEHYRLPFGLRKANSSLPKRIRPVFRDKLELSGGLLSEEIQKALQQSKYLIVICSPASAKSQWVNKEVQIFVELGRAREIIPFIVDGEPFSSNPDTECCTPALRALKGEDELLGVNINELGRDAAAVKVVARMFGLRFDTLWQRFERERKRRLFLTLGIILFALLVGFYFFRMRQTLGEQKEMIAVYQGRTRDLAERWKQLILEDEDLIKRTDEELLNTLKQGETLNADAVFRQSATGVVAALSNVVDLGDDVYEVDGLRYLTDAPTEDVIRTWADNYKDVCAEKIQERLDDYSVPSMMIRDNPALVYLILESRSMEKEDKQTWFELYHLMSDAQVMKLYNILYRERRKLAQIVVRNYSQFEEISRKYKEIESEYQSLRSLAKEHPKYFYDLYAELQDKMLDVYILSNRIEEGGVTYLALLSEALEDCEFFYKTNPSCKHRLAMLRNRMGAQKLANGEEMDAVSLFESAYQLDSEASAPYMARGYNWLAYQYANDEDYDTALETIEKAISMQPLEANYYDSKGEILLMSGDVQGALDMWNKVIELDPDFAKKHKSTLYKELEWMLSE